MTLRALVLLSALACSGCASMAVNNPNLGMEGQAAVRADQLVNALSLAQRTIEPLIDQGVLTASEGLKVAEVFRDGLETARRIAALLSFANQTRAVVERVATYRKVGSDMRDLLRSMTTATNTVSSEQGRVAVSESTGHVTDALAELLPYMGGTK